MKPNVKSKYFLLALLAVIGYFAHMLILQAMVKDSILAEVGRRVPGILFFTPNLLISLAGLFFLKSTNKNQSRGNQLLAFALAPFILSPILVFIYVLMILMPIYSLVGEKLQ